MVHLSSQTPLQYSELYFILKPHGGVVVRVLVSSVVDRGFEPRSDQTKDYKIDTCICCISAKHATLFRESGKTS